MIVFYCFVIQISESHTELHFPEHIRTNSTGAVQFYEGIIVFNYAGATLRGMVIDHPSNQPFVHSTTSSVSLPHHYNNKSSSQLTNGNFKRNRSFRDSFRKAFTR